MSEEMPDGFTPNTGRPPLVDPMPVYRRIAKVEPGKWICFTTYNENQVRSLKKQLTRLGVEVSVSTTTAHKNPAMYCRLKES